MRVFLAALAFALVGGAAQAATLLPVDLTDTARFESSRQLFGAEIKRDQNVQNSGGSGKDAFLRDGTDPNTSASFNVGWGVSGTSYAWSLGYDGNLATLTLGSATTSVNVSADGNWNAFSLYVRALDSDRFSSVTTSFSITKVNGSDLLAPLSVSATNGNTPGAFALDGLGAITSLQGTLAFSFTVKPGANGSPNSRVAVNFGAIEAVPVPTAVPVPAALPLLASVIGGLAFLSRRQRKAA
jgi:hypothetical protein